ncbi:hypothetical protein BO71DRAFT_410861 [Aspergillus ellipticus CBS 707.79]|uniref:Uncharacterized protein n=1 Tax=Aspergillus ellipticus CBS 707.79 TaxID=1448320 RepID=A0A319D568_9EURO|nr:hypothetical protein BO71DRAFT_410861 [Aspergillus ellipticus CBS 707.79]
MQETQVKERQKERRPKSDEKRDKGSGQKTKENEGTKLVVKGADRGGGVAGGEVPTTPNIDAAGDPTIYIGAASDARTLSTDEDSRRDRMERGAGETEETELAEEREDVQLTGCTVAVEREAPQEERTGPFLGLEKKEEKGEVAEARASVRNDPSIKEPSGEKKKRRGEDGEEGGYLYQQQVAAMETQDGKEGGGGRGQHLGKVQTPGASFKSTHAATICGRRSMAIRVEGKSTQSSRQLATQLPWCYFYYIARELLISPVRDASNWDYRDLDIRMFCSNRAGGKNGPWVPYRSRYSASSSASRGGTAISRPRRDYPRTAVVSLETPHQLLREGTMARNCVAQYYQCHEFNLEW